MIQHLINQADQWHAEEGEEYIPITLEEAIKSMSILPPGFNYGPFFHSDVKEFRKMMGLPQGAKLPRLGVDEYWHKLWNSEYFSAKMGPLSCKVFAYASVKTGETITPIYDDTGHKVMVYNPQGFRYRYAHTPDLAE
jgi:hypothetical protein